MSEMQSLSPEEMGLIQEEALTINDEVDARRNLVESKDLSNTELATRALLDREEAADMLSATPELRERLMQTYKREAFGSFPLYVDPQIEDKNRAEIEELKELISNQERVDVLLQKMCQILPDPFHHSETLGNILIFIHSCQNMDLIKSRIYSDVPKEGVQNSGRATQDDKGGRMINLSVGWGIATPIFVHEITHFLEEKGYNLDTIFSEGFANLASDQLSDPDMPSMRSCVVIDEIKKLIFSDLDHALARATTNSQGRTIIPLHEVLTIKAQRRTEDSADARMAGHISKYEIPTLFLEWYQQFDPKFEFTNDAGYSHIESLALYFMDRPEDYGDHRQEMALIASPLCQIIFPRSDPTVAALEIELARVDTTMREKLTKLFEFVAIIRPAMEQVEQGFNAHLNYQAEQWKQRSST